MFESLLSIKAIYFEAVEIFRTIGQIQRFCTPLYSTGWGILIFVCRWSQYNILNTQLIHFGKSEVKQKERETDKKKPLIVPRGSVRTLLITTFQLVIHISSLIFFFSLFSSHPLCHYRRYRLIWELMTMQRAHFQISLNQLKDSSDE